MDTRDANSNAPISTPDKMDHDHAGSPGSSSNPNPSTNTLAYFDGKEDALGFLHSLLNKNLRVTTTDGRMFWGALKCTDPENNIILQYAYEYRQPSARKLAEAAAEASADGRPSDKIKLDMTSRYLGLIVVPGEHIVKMEVEEFASQMKTRI